MNDYWKLRIENIKKNVRLRSVVDLFGIFCQSEGEITQIHCPFHGSDSHASARIYSSNTMYCWVCSKSWDVIGFVRDLKHISFQESCAFLEDAYGLQKINRIESQTVKESFDDYVKSHLEKTREKDFDKEFEKISHLLISTRDQMSLKDYVCLFHRWESLYYSYMTDETAFDADIQLKIDALKADIPASRQYNTN